MSLNCLHSERLHLESTEEKEGSEERGGDLLTKISDYK